MRRLVGVAVALSGLALTAAVPGTASAVSTAPRTAVSAAVAAPSNESEVFPRVMGGVAQLVRRDQDGSVHVLARFPGTSTAVKWIESVTSAPPTGLVAFEVVSSLKSTYQPTSVFRSETWFVNASGTGLHRGWSYLSNASASARKTIDRPASFSADGSTLYFTRHTYLGKTDRYDTNVARKRVLTSSGSVALPAGAGLVRPIPDPRRPGSYYAVTTAGVVVRVSRYGTVRHLPVCETDSHDIAVSPTTDTFVVQCNNTLEEYVFLYQYRADGTQPRLLSPSTDWDGSMSAPVYSSDGYRIYGYPETLNVLDLSSNPPTETRLPTPTDNNLWGSTGVGVVYR